MIIVAILQNQWFRNAEAARRMYARIEFERRPQYVERFLFAGCQTGRRLRQAFGEARCGEILWEEASTQIGDVAGAVFPADLDHLRRVIVTHQPSLVLAFGTVASVGCESLAPDFGWKLITGPHPASRAANTRHRLGEMAAALMRVEKEMTSETKQL